MSMGGCADACTMGENGTNTPDFCDGAPASPKCKACLADKLGDLNIDPNDPAACN
jgi:hypothetical protein